MSTGLPLGFRARVANIGIKDSTNDFTLVVAETVCTAAGVFTQSRFAGPSVIISRENLAHHSARGVVVISKNANVATGEEGMANAREIIASVAAALSCDQQDLLIASTGVIGRQYPMANVRAGLARVDAMPSTGLADDVASAIMTTDTVAKIAAADLDKVFRNVIDRTFNCVSVDTDTSTSDTAVILASGASGAVDLASFENALDEVALSLTKQVARDGEGAEKLIEVHVDTARDYEQAKTVAKAIVNSPLVKTAVHGADPNWGRVAMAVGKCSQYSDIQQQNVVIRFGTQEVYPTRVDDAGLAGLSTYMRGTDVRIHVSLATGNHSATVWGCDLTADYVRINADYTT